MSCGVACVAWREAYINSAAEGVRPRRVSYIDQDDLPGLHLTNTHRIMWFEVAWLALGNMLLRRRNRLSMRMRDESTSTDGPLISAVVTIWLTSSASSCLGTRFAFNIEWRSTQAARLTGGRDNARTPKCQSCFQDELRDACRDASWVAKLLRS